MRHVIRIALAYRLECFLGLSTVEMHNSHHRAGLPEGHLTKPIWSSTEHRITLWDIYAESQQLASPEGFSTSRIAEAGRSKR